MTAAILGSALGSPLGSPPAAVTAVATAPTTAAAAAMVHLQIAETGKRAALRGDHKAALGHYREAMRLAVSGNAPEVFFRHYLEAMLESLELSGALDSVLAYCDRAIAHYAAHPPPHAVATLDLASIHQRRGVALLKRGDTAPATAALEQAIALAAPLGAKLALAKRLVDWIRRGLAPAPDRIVAEQRRTRYFSVRPETVGALPAATAAPIIPAPAAPHPLAPAPAPAPAPAEEGPRAAR